MTILTVQNLNFYRESQPILEGLTFSLIPQQIVGLAGPNGGGKSTLFEVLMGWHGANASIQLNPSNRELTLLPQNVVKPRSLPLSVEDFVRMGTWGVHRKSTPAMSLDEVFSALALDDWRSKSVHELSGGKWRLACIARVLVQSADLYLFDEPLNHLDLESEDRVGQLLRKLVTERRKTFFVISHDWHAMEHYFDRVILLNRKILADGSVRDVGQIYSNWRDPTSHSWMHMS